MSTSRILVDLLAEKFRIMAISSLGNSGLRGRRFRHAGVVATSGLAHAIRNVLRPGDAVDGELLSPLARGSSYELVSPIG